MTRAGRAAALAVVAGSLVARVSRAGGGGGEVSEAAPTEITVTAPRRHDRGTVVTVLGEAEIERLGATSVGETLERLPAITSGAGSRGERVLTLRGFDQRQIAVFVDGVPVYVPYDGQLDLAKVPVDMVSRVAVVKGSGTLLYGPNGLGGAIDIVTRDPSPSPTASLRIETAPWSAARASVVGGTTWGPVGAVLGVAVESVRYTPLSGGFSDLPNQAEGRRNNSDRRTLSASSKWTWDLSPSHRLTLSASRFGGTFGVPPATRDLAVRYWRWTDWESSSVGLGHAYRGGRLQTEAVVYASLFSNTLDSYDDGRYATQRFPRAFHTTYDDTSLGGFARTSFRVPVGVTRELLVRSWTGMKHDTHGSLDSRTGRDPTVATTTLTASGDGRIDLLPTFARVSGGVQVDAELPGAPPSGPRPEPRAAVGPLSTLEVTPARGWSVIASAASRTRFPTLRERFSTVFGARDPNPLLAPERAWNLSLDAVYRPSGALRVAVGLFDSELRDLISPVVVAPGTDQLQNVGRARYTGVEAEVTFAPIEALAARAGWTALRARSGPALDQPVAYRPREKGLVELTVTPVRSLSLTGVLRHVGEQDYQNLDTGRWGRLGAYQLLDARAEWRMTEELRAWVRAQNLTDANVEARYSFPEAGRTVFVGLGAQLAP